MRRALSALLLLLPPSALAHKTGISGYSGKQNDAGVSGPTCTSCHTASGTIPSATITAPATLNVNATTQVAIVITAGGMATTVAGLDVALGNEAAVGSSLTPGPGTQLLNGEVTHLTPRAFDGGITTFDFSVTAGVTNGRLTIYAAVNAANNDGANTGDNPYILNKTLMITGTPPPPDAGPPDAGPPQEDGGTPVETDAGSADAGPRTPSGPPGGFVDGIGCTTGGGASTAAWLLGLGVLGLARRMRQAVFRRRDGGGPSR
jgi:MYXO-CTERM domain-containing protein